ncbi:hypothetical protein SAMN04244569_04152 [Paracoccus denitrificans]|jgi:hypothetical protein|nr:hypothetical protein SAMN04244569_04152 [Paracoccus denitrificans]
MWNAAGYVDNQRLQVAASCAETGRSPVQPDKPQEALDEPGRLPDLHAKEHLY